MGTQNFAERQEPTNESSLQSAPEMVCTPSTETGPNKTSQGQCEVSTNESSPRVFQGQELVCTPTAGNSESHQPVEARRTEPSKGRSPQSCQKEDTVCTPTTKTDDIPTQSATYRTDQTQFAEPATDASVQHLEIICTPTTEADDIPEAELSEDTPGMVTTTHVLTITSRHRTPSAGIGALPTASVRLASSLSAPGNRYNGTVVRSRGLPVSAPGGRVVHTSGHPRQEGLPQAIWTAELAEAAVPGCGMNPIQTFVINGTEFMLPPLPAGWRVAVQNERPYYFHPDHGQSYCCPVVLPSTTETAVRRSVVDRSLLNSLSRVLLDRAQLVRDREEQTSIRNQSPLPANDDDHSSPTLNSPAASQHGIVNVLLVSVVY